MNGESEIMFRFVDRKWKQFNKEYKKCKKKLTEKRVHNIRVALRRLMAMVEILSPIVGISDKKCKKYLKELKKNLKIFSDLRDVQVSALYVENLKEDFPDLDVFHEHLMNLEKDMKSNISKEIKSIDRSEIKKISKSLQKKLLKNGDSVDLYSKLLKESKSCFDEVISHLEKANRNDLDSIHKVRISFKKFRYMVEALDQIKPVGEKLSNDMKLVQDTLGQVQDMNVIESLLSKFINTQPEGCGMLSIEYHEFLKRQAELVDYLLKNKDIISSLDPEKSIKC